MREPLEIIAGIRSFISNSNPFRFPFLKESMLNSLTELENALTPQPVVEEVIEEPIVEEPIVEKPMVEEPIEVVAPKKRPRKV
jgi:hypothetical protein